MDNITHTFTGLAISCAGFNRKTRYATIAILVGANLPDIDIVSAVGGGAAYLNYHRGPTHSIVGVTLLAAALWACFFYLNQKFPPRKKGVSFNAKWLFWACWTATASHLILDLTNSYGVRVFWPFSNHWYALDLEFIVDPLLLGLIIGALSIPALFRLISEELGAQKSGFQRGAITALCLMVGLWSVRWFAHQRAINMEASRTFQDQNPLQIAAFPSPLSPFTWTGEAETETSIDVFPVDVFGSEVDPDAIHSFTKPIPSPALDAAKKTRTAKVFLAFARFPWAVVDETADGWEVTIRDLRFLSASTRRAGFVVHVTMDKRFNILSQSFSFH